MKPAFTRLLTGIIVLLNVFNFAFWFVMLYPWRVISIKDIQLLTPVVEQGKQVAYTAKVCKYINVPGEAQRYLVDHYQYPLVAEITNQIGHGCATVVIHVPIPLYVDPGVYHIHNDLTHRVFGIRDITTHYETPEFYVIKHQEDTP